MVMRRPTGTWIAALLAGACLPAACSDAPSGDAPGDAPGARGPRSGAVSAPAPAGGGGGGGGDPSITGRQPVPLSAALQAWIDRAAAEIGAPTLSVAEVAAQPERPVILDVRDAHEIAVSSIPLAMPLPSESARLEYLHKGGGGTVVVVSTVGFRAAQYVQALRGAGVQAFALQGGICAWAAAGGRLVDRQGRLAARIHADADHAACVPEGYTAVADG
jgi:rhodanese-related sulfurtransferase